MLLDTFKKNPDFKLLPLVNDAIFKIYFEAEENRDVLKDFLKAHLDDITDHDLTDIQAINPILTRTYPYELARPFHKINRLNQRI